ncbi:MAG: hypothetical protein AAGG69_10390 [Pseudomonadota bacterium]
MKAHTVLAIASILSATSVHAADLASGQQISEAISGNTVQGGMEASGVYTEYYAADGVVRGADYTAKWMIEGDMMCWLYEGSEKDCWNASIDGDQIGWVQDGENLGTGTILSANPNNF